MEPVKQFTLIVTVEDPEESKKVWDLFVEGKPLSGFLINTIASGDLALERDKLEEKVFEMTEKLEYLGEYEFLENLELSDND